MKDTLAYAAIPLVIVLFLAVNLLAGTMLPQTRLDLTERRLHTLSEATHETLSRIDEPIKLRFYRSEGLEAGGPALADHARRVREMLDHYAGLADGKIELSILRPAPFSPEEDRAMAEGLEGVPLGPQGRPLVFGLAGSNTTDDEEAIAFFAPERAALLEYELTRLVMRLAEPRETRVGVLGALPLESDGRPQRVLEALRRDYDVRLLGGERERIDPRIDILLLAQPSGLSDATLDAIDGFVGRGGKTLAFVDPFSEALAQAQAEDAAPLARGAGIDEGLERLLASWGVSVDPGTVVADEVYARRVRSRVGGRDGLVDFVAWLAIPPGGLAPDDPVTAPLSELSMRTAGRIEPLADAATQVQPLALSSLSAMPLAVERMRGFPDPSRLLADFTASGARYTLAARIEGLPAPIILVADSDLLLDDAWTHAGDSGEAGGQAYADNATFVLNALDALSGGGALMELRGRSRVDRPFTLIEDMRRDAERQYRGQEQRLIDAIHEARERIRSLNRLESERGLPLDSDERAEVERLRQEIFGARSELREVQHNLHAEVEQVKSWVRAANIGGMPALVALLAIAVGMLRRRRRSRRALASG